MDIMFDKVTDIIAASDEAKLPEEFEALSNVELSELRTIALWGDAQRKGRTWEEFEHEAPLEAFEGHERLVGWLLGDRNLRHKLAKGIAIIKPLFDTHGH